MREKLRRTLATLSRYGRRGVDLLGSLGSPSGSLGGLALVEVTGFGSNPGHLRMLAHVPDKLASPRSLVVVLHGCTQTAAGYDHGAGWSTLADRYGFAVLFPEQRTRNNPKWCFNWFLPAHASRGRGEALSIRQMVERMVVDQRIDRRRVFVTGLSAGGAMTCVMLATYPDVFAGGGIIAGLPYGSATNVQEALEAMFEGRRRPAPEWGDLVRRASPHRGPWPRLSVWHGSADATVNPANAEEILKQWTDVHGVGPGPASTEIVDGYPRRLWRNRAGEDVVEAYTITGMAHGTPLSLKGGDDRHGNAGPFLIDAGIASSYHIAKFWGLTGQRVRATAPAPQPMPLPDATRAGGWSPHRTRPPVDVAGAIAKVLKAARSLKP